MKNYIKKILKKLLGANNHTHASISFYLTDFLFRKILRHNSKVKWPIHFTSTIHSPENLFIGKETFPGDSPGVYINALNKIYIGDYTNIGPKVSIISANHDPLENRVLLEAPPIKIGRHCWVGTNAVILPGVILGDHTIVGANAVVTKSFEGGHCIIAGNPARILKELH
ncbi:acyltransferase [Arachidicoccus ginsenosidivorans]|uniref:Acyltransferase n=1 Tax=Arachidicoccus ginsenosidivorans TaxID=496057 RepID=A0A5B8VS80_9BACT|nr:acyltransferase [Arachidicoccus ginsenosidivorans]